MESPQNSLNDLISEINSYIELDLKLSELSPQDLHDPVGLYDTAFCDYFSSQSHLNGNNCSYYGNLSNFDPMSGYNATSMNPHAVTSSLVSIPSDNSTEVVEELTSTNACQLEYPGNERYLDNEHASPVNSMFDGVSSLVSIPSDNSTEAVEEFTSTNACQFEYPENERYLENEHASPVNSMFDGVSNTGLPNLENNAEAHVATHQELTDEKEINGQNVYPKPACSYTYLVGLAFKNSRTAALPVNEIYSFICKHFPYYRTAPKIWKNSVRHNLTFNSIFKKIDTTTAVNNPIKRKNLWTIDPKKVAKMNQKLQKSSHNHSLDIKKAMLHPEHLELLECGELKFGSDEQTLQQLPASNQDDFVDAHDAKLNYTSEHDYQLVPVAKRQKTLKDMPQVDYFYEVTIRRKTPLTYLTTEAVTEPSFEDDQVIDSSSHGF